MPETIRHYDMRLRRVPERRLAAFAETTSGTAQPRRSMRLITQKTMTAIAARYAGKTVVDMGRAIDGTKSSIAGWDFTYAQVDDAWKGSKGGCQVWLTPECSTQSVNTFLESFDSVMNQAPGLLTVHQQVHILGRTSTIPDQVALAQEGKVVWFNHPNGILLASAIAEVTQHSNEPFKLDRMICHEAAHVMEPYMKDWLQELTRDLQQPGQFDAMRDLALKISPQYLHHRSQELNTGYVPDADHADEWAAEMLVEMYSHQVMEKLPWPKGIWLCADGVAEAMLKEPCHDPAGKILRLPNDPDKKPPRKARIMLAPATVEVPSSIGQRGGR